MSILKILNEIADNPSRLAKEAILKREKNNELLKAVILAAYHPYINYFQKKIPEYKTLGKNSSLAWGLDGLTELSTRTVTGHAAIDWLKAILQDLSADDAKVLERVIDRDLRAGFSESTANKIWPNLVPTFDVQLSHKDISGIRYPAYAQTKMDGARCHLHFDGKEATAYARSGKIFKLHGVFDDSASIMMEPNETWDGEIIFLGPDGKFLDRKTSNGLANKANKGTLSAEAAKQAVFVTWDIVDFSSKTPYKIRFTDLTKRFADSIQAQFKTRFRLVKSQVVNSVDEAIEFYNEERNRGEEGAILKNIDSVWVPKRTKDLGKMKAEEEADLEIIGWEVGTGKNKNRMGNIICATSDRKLVVNVGIGFSDEDRDEEWPNGTIVTTKYNEVIKDKKSDTFSLFLPRFVERRFDKKVANSFEELK
jgi:hypothetical protein